MRREEIKMNLKMMAATTFIAFLITGCDPMDKKIPSDIAKWDSELKPVIEKLPEDEKILINEYLAKAKQDKIAEILIGKPSEIPEDITIGQAIEAQREKERKAKENSERRAKIMAEKEAENLATRNEMAKVSASLLFAERLEKGSNDLEFLPNDEGNLLGLRIFIMNHGNKDISGFKGRIYVKDIYNKEIDKIYFDYSGELKAGEDAACIAIKNYNQFMDEHNALLSLEDDKYSSEFTIQHPEAILYADGTILESPIKDTSVSEYSKELPLKCNKIMEEKTEENADKSIPEIFRGIWVPDKSICGQNADFPYGDSGFEVSKDTISGYESNCSLKEILKQSDDSIAANFDCGGPDGSEITSVTMALSPDQNTISTKGYFEGKMFRCNK